MPISLVREKVAPQVFEAGGCYYLLYAGMKGREWQSGLAKARKESPT